MLNESALCGPMTSPGPEAALARGIAAEKAALLAHPLYDAIDSIEALRAFMETHVYAVWDFMSLVKRLQNAVTCTTVPWLPPRDATLARLINDIVLAEESDLGPDGAAASHFTLYRRAMGECGASTRGIDAFLAALGDGAPLTAAFDAAEATPIVRRFVGANLQLAREGTLSNVAAVFAQGRENVIPGMFQRLLPRIAERGAVAATLAYYCKRHIELDGCAHGAQANLLVRATVGTDATLLAASIDAVKESLMLRCELWDGVLTRIRRERGDAR